MPLPSIAISIIVFLVVLYAFYRIAKKLAYNTIIGIALLILMNLTIFSDNPIAIKFTTALIVAVGGVIGAILVAGLHYFGML